MLVPYTNPNSATYAYVHEGKGNMEKGYIRGYISAYICGYIHPGRRGRERPSTGHSLRVYGETERTPRMLTRRISLVLVRTTPYRLAIILITQHVVMSTGIRNILHLQLPSQPWHSHCLYAKTERIRTLYLAVPFVLP